MTSLPAQLVRPLALLDAPETNAQPPVQCSWGIPPLTTSPGICWRHSGWARHRQLVYDALHRCGTPDRRIESYRNCGTGAWVFESVIDPGQYVVRSDRCNDRFCSPCARERSRVIGHNLSKAIGDQLYRMITLTLRSTQPDLAGDLDRLYVGFRRLRRSDLWRDNVTASAAFCEIKWISKTNHWHVHMHILAIGRWMDKDDLSAAWLHATGDSYVVDIRLPRDHARVIGYVIKYASKPLGKSFVNRPDRLDEAVRALKGRRLCLTTGGWRGLPLTASPEPGEWTPVISLDSLVRRARHGDADALRILGYLEERRLCIQTSVDHTSASGPEGPSPST